MKTREYRVWFSINVELPDEEDPKKAYRTARFNLENNKPQPYSYSKAIYEFQHLEEIKWYRSRDCVIRRWTAQGWEQEVDSQIARSYKAYRERLAREAKEEAEKLKQQVEQENVVAP